MAQNVLTLEDFMNELKDKGGDGTSTYNLRNEQAQVKVRARAIPRLKKELKKKSKLLVAMELAIPFNPFTGQADDTYNVDKKFRPQKSATTVALMLKQQADKTPELKAVFMKRSGVTEWDTSDYETLTTVDFEVFKPYRVPQVYTFPVVHADVPAMTGEYGRDYVIKVDRDPVSGNIIGEWPLALKANQFFRDIAFEEYNEFKEKCAKGEHNYTEKQQKEHASKIFSKIPVSEDHPVNYIVAMELELSSKYELTKSYEDMKMTDVNALLVQTRRSKKLTDSLSNYLSGDWSRYDVHFDFVEIDMACPAEGATPAEIGQGTAYEKPTDLLTTSNSCEAIRAAFREFLDEETGMEQTMINSVRIAKYDEHVEAQLCAALSTVVDKDNKYITKSVIEHNREFITVALGEMGDQLLLALVDDDDERAQGSLNPDEAAKVAKEISVNDVLSEDLDNIDLETIE